MKQTRLQIFGTLGLALLISSCSGLDKMKEAAKQIQFKVDPEVLEAHQGKVAMSFTANVPAKMWDKKVVAEITPVLTYEGGQDAFPAINVQGEAAQSNGQTISYTNGGQIKYPKQEIDFKDAQRVSDLIVRIKFTRGSKSFEVTSKDLQMPALAKGVIATSTLLGEQPGVSASSKDKFVRDNVEEKVAEIVYLINQAEVRGGQLKKEDVVAINNYIKELNADEKKSIKSIAISAYASPDGSTDINTKLSGKREASANKYLANTLKKAKVDAQVETDATPEDWDGFKKAVEASDIQDKDLIIRVLSLYSDPDVREKEIKNLSAVYKVLAKEILPGLRRSTITVTGELKGKTDDEIKAADKNSLTLEELLFGATLETDADKQIAYYDAAIANYPNDYRAFNNKGVALYKKGDIDGAKAQFEKAEAVNAAPEVENNLGVIALAKNDINAAKEYFGKAAGTGSALDENLGVTALFEGDYEKAESYFANSTSCNAALVKILLDKFDAAIAVLNANNEETGLKYYLKAVAFANKKDKDGALENLNKAAKIESKWKSYAKTDMEFYAYFNDSNFKSIVE
ncbi:MAG: hypothetical protein MR215_09790 [Bacteroidales bacterium]|nr:hypothetical protein [Bacteroidales bacterium]MDY4174429.1 hypothetical protein [Bacteroidales bacterium]